jgi:CheY-like chemotaxis protein
MGDSNLVPAQPQGIVAVQVDAFSRALHQYLDQLGIPSQNILIEVDQRGRIPAAALTALTGKDYRHRALQAGFQMHVPKPVDAAHLQSIVATLAERSLEESPESRPSMK